jgi:hypothetical protein
MNSGIEVFFTVQDTRWNQALTTQVIPNPPAVPDPPYRFNVYGPNGAVHLGVPAPNGYASLDLPPGTYVITGNAKGLTHPNYDSNETVVTVCRGMRACVTIVPRNLHSCISWVIFALQAIGTQPKDGQKVAELVKDAIAPLQKIADAIPVENRML